MDRKSVLQWKSFSEVNKDIESSFVHDYGPGALPTGRKKIRVVGIISPSYVCDEANPALAWSYKEIAEAEFPEVFIIIGRTQHGLNTSLFMDWETSLGLVKINNLIGRNLINSFPKLKNNIEPFLVNTTIEMQLPFLLYACKDSLEKVSFIPILLGDDVNFEDITLFADILSDLQIRICIICAANFTCYGREFNHIPFVHSIKQNLYAIDEKFIEYIISLDSKGLDSFAKTKKILDKNVFLLFIEIMRGLAAKKAKLLKYYTSGDLSGYEKSIGMGALSFYLKYD